MNLEPQFEFASDNSRAGFRLQRVEVLNWGTFGEKTWKIEPGGNNSLLTGDIGSGKSTLVDAITTLMVPHQKITYNRAAGAETKERNLRSYIRGEYKNTRLEDGEGGKAVYLRENNEISMLLAAFHSEGLNQTVVLAQVLWLGDTEVKKFFLGSLIPLSIKSIHQLDTDIGRLKKKLRGHEHVEVWDNFKDYSIWFRRQFGIHSEKALDLFYQTVSMKSVGHLTDFVRQQMLEETDVRKRIKALKENFDNLTQSYNQVKRARRQLELLEPLLEHADAYLQYEQEWKELEDLAQAVPVYFAVQKMTLLQHALNEVNDEISLLTSQLSGLEDELDELRKRELQIKVDIGQTTESKRLNEIENDLRTQNKEKERRKAQWSRYDGWVKRLEMSVPKNDRTFLQNRKQAESQQSLTKQEQEKLEQERIDLGIWQRQVEDKIKLERDELESLQSRTSQLPGHLLRMRAEMLEVLQLREEDLPFAGELLKVRQDEADWEGAIERVLHNFGQSLLVAEQNYNAVSRYVNQTKLKGRLVYFKTMPHKHKKPVHQLDHQSMVHKLEIKPGAELNDWLENELCLRFDLVCCESIQQFQNERFALTQQGQLKRDGRRHEKDDSRDLKDRRKYVLGWDNQAKIEAIEQEVRLLEKDKGEVEELKKEYEQQIQSLRQTAEDLRDLLQIEAFSFINWQQSAQHIQRLLEEKQMLEESSDVLKSLNEELAKVQTSLKFREDEQKEAFGKEGRLTERQRSFRLDFDRSKQLSEHLVGDKRNELFDKLSEYLPEKTLSLPDLENGQIDTGKRVRGRQNNVKGWSKAQSQQMIAKMSEFKSEFAAEANEMLPAPEYIEEFRQLTTSIKHDRLPDLEERFRNLLKEKTIQDILIFNNKLDEYRKKIEAKINRINEALCKMEYNRGTYIELNAELVNDHDIATFRRDLRECLSDTVGADDEVYTEEKFLQVKAILDRFNSAENIDRRWRDRVTDVRNWFVYSATERYLDTREEKEYYSDSSGKSGGQKEKLAYTILASALAYQFGLDTRTVTSRSFRFAVIDEAFGRGSDDSARYGLELFKKLDLQLLIVTPLQKIHVIEPFISAVHYVSNTDGKNSVVRDLTMEEYQEEKSNFVEKTSLA